MQKFVCSSGASSRTRTDDLRITNALLYQLSHTSKLEKFCLRRALNRDLHIMRCANGITIPFLYQLSHTSKLQPIKL